MTNDTIYEYTLYLDGGTIGKTTSRHPISEGDFVTVYLRDKNGNPITASGRVADILKEEIWEDTPPDRPRP